MLGRDAIRGKLLGIFTVLAMLMPVSRAFAAPAGGGATPGVVANVDVPTSPVAVAVDPTNRRVFVASYGAGVITVFDESTLRSIATLGAGTDLAVDSAIGRLYVAGSGGVVVYDDMTDQVVATMTTTAPTSNIAVDPSTHVVYVGEPGSTLGAHPAPAIVQSFDGQTDKLLASGIIGNSPSDAGLRSIGPMAVDSSSHRVFVVSTTQHVDETVTMLDGSTLQQLKAQPTGGTTFGVAVDPGTHLVFVSAASSVLEFDGASLDFTEVRPIPVDYNPRPVAVDPLLHLAYVGNGGVGPFPSLPVILAAPVPEEALPSGVFALDEETGHIVLSVPFQMTLPSAMALDPVAHLAFVVSRDDNRMVVVQVLGGQPTDPHDNRYFEPTGFRIDDDTIWDYFNRRGSLATFGYPVSRTFVFQGFTVQFFQRRVVQLDQNGNARLLNVLDPGLLPYATFNGSTFPSSDASLVATAPNPGDTAATLAFVMAHTPNQFQGAPVNFAQTFLGTIQAAAAFPNGGNVNLLPGFDLEMWGVPTSQVLVDPGNHHFVYVRFQRGIMMFNADCTCSLAVLLADYLKSVLTGVDLPPDLAQEAQNSPLFKQYDPTQPKWVHDPALLPNTNLTNAFTPE